MSNDYALFIILVPNDFDQNDSVIPTTHVIEEEPTPSPINTVSALVAPASIPLLSVPTVNPIIDSHDKHLSSISQRMSTQSSCVALKNYFAEKNHIAPVWMLSNNKKIFQISFYVEFGHESDRILEELGTIGIGIRTGTKIFVLPTTVIIEGRNSEKTELISSLTKTDENNEKFLSVNSIEETVSQLNDAPSNDLTLSRKIRKRLSESNFKKSVRARLMVHQVVASIRASTVLSFDFVVLICLASILAALGLLENSSVILVASMLVSPLMNPILGIVFGLSVREHSLWRRGFRNEVIGLIICITCGFLLGLFTTFSETRWGNSTSFPTAEMRARGDVKRLWIGVLIALPSGAGVALSVLGGNTGSLVGVAISASLLPPAVNCGLLFAYASLSLCIPSIAAIRSSTNSSDDLFEFHSSINCTKYIKNDYIPLYACNLAKESAILACCSLLLTIVNIICIIIMALIILRIKEVAPLHQPNKDLTNFFHHDVKIARDYNKTLHEGDENKTVSAVINSNNLAQTIVNRWKTFKASNSGEQQLSTTMPTKRSSMSNIVSESMNNRDMLEIDMESRRKLLRLRTFAKEYDLDVFNKRDYDLTDWDSREKVLVLISDLLDMCQEATPSFVDLCRFQPYGMQTSMDNEHRSFYQEIIELLPPKWYQLFEREQQYRHTLAWSSLHRSHSLRVHRSALSPSTTLDSGVKRSESIELSLKKHRPNRIKFHRQSSVPESRLHATTRVNQVVEIPIEGTRFRVTKPDTTTQLFGNESKLV